MESFGLFDLLKSLSTFKPQSPSPTSEKTDVSPPVTPTANPLANSPTIPTIPTNKPFDEPTFEQIPNNACLDFINRHDELARRRKRK